MKKNKILSFAFNLFWVLLVGGLACLPIFLGGAVLGYFLGYGLLRAALLIVFGLLYTWKIMKYLDVINNAYANKLSEYSFYSPLFAKKEEPKKLRIAEQPSVFEEMRIRQEVVDHDLRDFDHRLRMKE